MDGIGTTHVELWNPLGVLGITHDFFKLNAETIINTWITLAVLFICALIANRALTKKNSLLRFTLIAGIQGLKNLMIQSMGCFDPHHCTFIAALFIFIIFCNWASLLPFVEEPTKDLNTALAMGITAFAYKEYYAIKTHGLKHYLLEFCHPIFLMLPVNLIGHFSKIISSSFRLYGNIFGGAIITQIYFTFLAHSPYLQLVGLLSPFNYIIVFFFVVFEGLIQAFVFSILAMTYLALAIHKSNEGAQTT